MELTVGEVRWYREHPNIIPPMTHPLSSHWHQPSSAGIEIDDTHALMSKLTFKLLPEYSCSRPSGVYEGKMWKRENGAFDYEFMASGGKPEWLLCWYGYSVNGNPDDVAIYSRKIILA